MERALVIWVTGDTHGDFTRFSHKKFPEGKKATKDDYMIIAGDFGGIWNVNESSKDEQYWLDWLTNKHFTTLMVDGNHENFDRLNAFPEKDMFGSKVGVVTDSIFHLKRGHIYNINGRTFFVFGGARSEDKNLRREYFSWWKEELPNGAEFSRGFRNLDAHDNTVDYIVTHTAPDIFRQKMGLVYENQPYDLPNYFDQIAKKAWYKRWFLGHFHFDYEFDKFTALYEKIVRIEDE